MSRRFCSALLVWSWLSVVSGFGASWHEMLCLGNDGYWPERVAVTVTNQSDQAAAGAPVEISIPALAGTRTEALRMCRADGVELLFDLRDARGAAKRGGVLRQDDKLIIPVECAAHDSETLFVYAGNEAAWPVPDFLPARMTNENGSIHASIGKVERLKLAKSPVVTRAPSGDWAEVRVRNLSDKAVPGVLVRVNVRAALARLVRLSREPGLRVFSAEGAAVPWSTMGSGQDLLFRAEIPGRTEQLYQIDFAGEASPRGQRLLEQYERLLNSDANLVRNGSFESGNGTAQGWVKSPGLANGQLGEAHVTGAAQFGARAVELNIARNDKAAWLGWNSQEIPVRPGAKYLLAGWLKALDLQGSASIHAHFHDARGALTRSGAMASTQPPVSGTSDWVNSQAIIQAPPDAATIQLHLTVNTSGTLRHDGILLCEVLDGSIGQVHAAGGKALAGAGLHAWEVNPLVKVFPETLPQAQARAVSLELARNEYEPFQLCFRSDAGPDAPLEISVSTLRDHDGAALPPVKVERVGFVPIDYPSAYYSTTVPEWCRKVPHGAGATDGWAGWWPDPLAPGESFDLPVSKTQPVWFTVHVPKLSAPGTYRGGITVATGDKTLVVIPLVVTVLPITLPDTTRLRAIFDFRFGPGGTFGSGAESHEQRRQWLRFIADHRLGIDAIRPEPKFSYRDEKVTMDAREFDETARVCFDELGMNVCYTPHFFYMFGWAYPPKKLFGLEPFTSEWISAFKQAYELFTRHVREKGWHDKFVYYISDEPHFQQAFVVEQMKRLCVLIHEVDRQIPIYSSTWRHCPAWDESLDLWGVGQYGCFPIDQMERLQRRGKEFWFTCDGQMATDTAYLATERLLPYYCQKYGGRGFEFWGLAWWTYDPWQTGWHRFIRQSDEGKKYYWVRYPDGDGFLAYPGKAVGVDGPVSTIRLEQVREGLEDYEAMQMLAERVRAAKRAGKSSESGERALQMAKDLVSIPNAGGLRSTDILPDPDRVRRIRKAINAALVELRQ